MDAVLRAVVLMSMLVLAIAQADINPSYTNVVQNGKTLGQVEDVSHPSNTNHVVPNDHLIPCGVRSATKCMIKCKFGPSDVVYNCTHNCANSIATTTTSGVGNSYYESCYKNNHIN
ncbi:hypothetical protein L3X38_039726 [Prunus dulcis]|uniref:Uncharacterized protein n=1 Tax=Prunus dulcis TaxID=3755 RepID=A0AAD4YTE3_PRUDU|nr:hypothetical protein L3X38_039726 [Prunus dulcis]